MGEGGTAGYIYPGSCLVGQVAVAYCTTHLGNCLEPCLPGGSIAIERGIGEVAGACWFCAGVRCVYGAVMRLLVMFGPVSGCPAGS